MPEPPAGTQAGAPRWQPTRMLPPPWRIARAGASAWACSAARSTPRTSATSSRRSTCATRSVSTACSSSSPTCRGRRRGSRRHHRRGGPLRPGRGGGGGGAGLEASRIELDRGGPSYTADTLAELATPAPGRRAVHHPRRGRRRRPRDVGALTRRWPPARRSSWSSARVAVRPARRASTGCASRCPTSRCRAPTCGPGSSTAARSTTCCRTRSWSRSTAVGSTGRPYEPGAGGAGEPARPGLDYCGGGRRHRHRSGGAVARRAGGHTLADSTAGRSVYRSLAAATVVGNPGRPPRDEGRRRRSPR